MQMSMHKRIKALIEETNDAYGITNASGNINADYAEFAAMAISEFKSLLGNPQLTQRDLRRMLRRACLQHKARDPESCWASYLANYIADTSNKNMEPGRPSVMMGDTARVG